MKKLTIELEDQLAKEIKAGKKAIAVINKEQLEDVDGGKQLFLHRPKEPIEDRVCD